MNWYSELDTRVPSNSRVALFPRGALNVAADATTGGCGSYDDLAERWTTTGFLLGFEVRRPLTLMLALDPLPVLEVGLSICIASTLGPVSDLTM